MILLIPLSNHQHLSNQGQSKYLTYLKILPKVVPIFLLLL
nr:MAG TPA: hypothetical protein [Caudoviricetes sp.]